VAHQRYWQARRMQAVAETSSTHRDLLRRRRHAPEAFKLQELRLAATDLLSGGAAAAKCAPGPFVTTPACAGDLQASRAATGSGRSSGGAAAAAEQQVSASQPNRTQPGTSNIPRRASRPELTRVECAARSQVQRTVRRCSAVACRVCRVSRPVPETQRLLWYYGGGSAPHHVRSITAAHVRGKPGAPDLRSSVQYINHSWSWLQPPCRPQPTAV
jgi:hypothetical protein